MNDNYNYKNLDKKDNDVNLSSPWISYFNKLSALFMEDTEIVVAYSESDDEKLITICVTGNWLKAICIAALLPKEKTFGNVTVKISVKTDTDAPDENVYDILFDGNPIYQKTKTVVDFHGFPTTYVLFNKNVIQYWDDNIYDINGNISTLAENIARDVFEDTEVHFCTTDEDPN